MEEEKVVAHAGVEALAAGTPGHSCCDERFVGKGVESHRRRAMEGLEFVYSDLGSCEGRRSLF